MTLGGWLILILSVGSVIALFAWCLYKVLCTPSETEKIHGFDMKTPDQRSDR